MVGAEELLARLGVIAEMAPRLRSAGVLRIEDEGLCFTLAPVEVAQVDTVTRPGPGAVVSPLPVHPGIPGRTSYTEEELLFAASEGFPVAKGAEA